MILTTLDNTLEKYLKLQLTPIQSSRVDLWLQTMHGKSFHGEDIGRNDEEILARMILGEHDGDLTKFIPKHSNISVVQEKITPIIVILSMTMCLLTGVFYMDGVRLRADLTSFENPINRIFLQDGTIVLTSGNSKLVYAASSDRRRVLFTGEGLFEVSKSYTLPLRLCIKNMAVEISGTCFVQTSASGFKVQVLNGIAEVQSNQKKAVTAEEGKLLVLQGDVISITSNAAMSIPTIYLSRYFMKFERADFWDVVLRIQDKFGVTIFADILNPQKVSGDFTGKSLSETLYLISEQLGLEYCVDGNIVKLKDKVAGVQLIH